MSRIGFIGLLVFFSLSVLGQDWKPLGPFYGKSKKETYMHSMGLVDAVLAHPTDPATFLMSTNSSGIWKTEDRGRTWNCMTEGKPFIPGMGAKSLAIHSTNPNEIIAGVSNYVYGFESYGGGILHSKDWGNTWELNSSFDSIFKGKIIIKALYSGDGKQLYVLGENELLLSEDNGKTWELIFEVKVEKSYIKDRAQTLVDMEVSQSGTVFVSSAHRWGARGNCWRSTDKGTSWTNLEDLPVFVELTKKHILSVKISSFLNKKGLIGFCDGKKIYLYKTLNDGNSFFKTGQLSLTWETGDAKASKFELEFSKENPDKVYFGFIEFFEWDSIKGLRMLSPSPNISANEHDDVRAMQVISQGGKEHVLMGNDGGISFYHPSNKTFESLNGFNLPTLQVYNLAISQQESNFTMFIGTQDNGTYQYKNKEWNFVSGGDGGGNWLSDDAFMSIKSNNNVLIVNQGKKMRYFSPNKGFSSWYIDFPVEVSREDSVILFGSAKRGGDGARLFLQPFNQMDQQGVEVKGMRKVGEIAVSTTNTNFIMVAEGEEIDKNDKTPKLMKTVDRGKTFIDLTDSPVYPDEYIDLEGRKKDTVTLRDMLSYRTITDIEIDPFDDDIIYVSLSGYLKPEYWTKSWEYYRVLKSEDGGETWYDYSAGLPLTPIHTLLRDERDESMLFCGGDEGVFHKGREREEWENYSKNLPANTVVTDLKLNYCQEQIYCSTYGRGVYTSNVYSISDYTEITENTTYSTYRFVNRDIDVLRGKTLTITSDIVMGPNNEITLYPKSKLIIDGGSITSYCGEKWNGVRIKEKKFLFFFKRKKGEVILTNGGELEEVKRTKK